MMTLNEVLISVVLWLFIFHEDHSVKYTARQPPFGDEADRFTTKPQTRTWRLVCQGHQSVRKRD